MLIVTPLFLKAPLSKCFPCTRKRKAGSSGLKSAFEKFRFRRISLDGKPNGRNKTAFANFSGVVWTLPKKVFKKNNKSTEIREQT